MVSPSLFLATVLLGSMIMVIFLVTSFPGKKWARNAVFFFCGLGFVCGLGALGSMNDIASRGTPSTIRQRGVMQQFAEWTIKAEQDYYKENKEYTDKIEDLVKINPLLAPDMQKKLIDQTLLDKDYRPADKEITIGLYLDRISNGMTLAVRDGDTGRMGAILYKGEITQATCSGLPFCAESYGQWAAPGLPAIPKKPTPKIGGRGTTSTVQGIPDTNSVATPENIIGGGG